MKKVWFALILVFGLLPGVASAQLSVEETKIQSVYYDPDYKAYYMVTAEDKYGSTWDLWLVDSKKENPKLTKSLNQSFLNQKVEVLYEDYNTEDYTQWELLDYTLTN
ncbi:hypothetical protein AM501_26840 [Aneurinibacillus migulanus]|uniref:Uncharacterized protein n=1 Tax=Aneurinibacillus migulanus TaxID=47500 RepID=A0A0D1XCH1_ANEMI|nr:hypothetical protein [Aneurinibacillus migulanus]KIV50073.1 hypothetical protein TS65_29900 [Aneurinibacillus migulanus]KIV55049.1 hypothetical protein TS64_12275 [Aneurinibacillus migulanus]KON95234.1 hypothetical protein AF333_06820 [Aneurinibacillus migulanus]KPD05334.1 hypothetical protein AM501_26840 [Aneurinibacillus migulanus]MED0895730.1 hypothetical protein [Aneurinibacillus migulanus]